MFEISLNLHPIFVHFSIGLWVVASLLFWGACLLKEKTFSQHLFSAANINLWLGSMISVMTLITGFYAYYTLPHDGPSHAAMNYHRNFAVITFIGFMVVTGWSVMNWYKQKKGGVYFLIILTFFTGLLFIVGYQGGELVYKHGLGVFSLPETGVHHH